MWKAKSPQTYDLARAPKRLAAPDLSLSYKTTYMYLCIHVYYHILSWLLDPI